MGFPWSLSASSPSETRSWATDYRGPLAIHAGKHCESGDLGEFNVEKGNPRGSDPRLPPPWPDRVALPRLPLGAVVATCKLVACVPTDRITWVPDGGLAGGLPWGIGDNCAVIVEGIRPYGDFSPGRFAFLLDDIERLPKPPVPARGRQGLWDWAL